MVNQVRKRNDLFAELNRRGLDGYAVEIGVAEGDYSCYLLDCCKKIVCYQVDPWTTFSTEEYQDYNNTAQEEQDRRYELVCRRAEQYAGRAVPIRKTSAEAVRDFQDSFFDFIYIDANHRYESIKEDLGLWWPKCKGGGIFAGHDYLDGVHGSADSLFGVKQAVTEFAAEHKLKINVTQERDWPTWWIAKP